MRFKRSTTGLALLRGLAAALLSAALLAQWPATEKWGAGVVFSLLVLGPELGWNPAFLAGSALAFTVNMLTLHWYPDGRHAGANPIALVGSCGLAAMLWAFGAFKLPRALGLALLGTALGYAFVEGLNLLPGRQPFGPRWQDYALAFALWQAPMAWAIQRYKQGPVTLNWKPRA
jgi:hypothetical protein